MRQIWAAPDGSIHDGQRRVFEPKSHGWALASSADPSGLVAVSASAAVHALVTQGGARTLPVGVIGPHDASPEELRFAAETGKGIARLSLPLICGGRGGCMQAASEGARMAGGLVIGILPSSDWMTANPHVSISIASGLGEARNAIIASACFALIAVGGGHGTLSEMALGLKMSRLVIAMPPAADVPGARRCVTVDEAIEVVAERYLGLTP